MRIGLFGGTFDPPHLGHVSAAKAAVERLGLDELLVVPTALPPHKALPDNVPNGKMRLEMTKIAMREIPNASVSDIELLRGGKSYTVDTLTEVEYMYPNEEIFLLMGTDMIQTFESWRDYKNILERCTLAVFTRRDGEDSSVKAQAENIKNKYGAKVVFVPHDVVEISSTDIRSLLQMRDRCDTLDEEVYAYIIKNRLYGAKVNFEWLREKAYSMLDSKRIPHVKGCEEEAVRLAERWGENVQEAREAGILHDITKKDGLQQQLILCEKYGIITDAFETNECKLLHSKTGAAIAKYEFGASDAVYNAIYWHTTGRANMSLLEKIIYLADYIEPNRDFTDLTQMRKLAYEDLDKAILMGMEMSLEDMETRGIKPHWRTQSAIDWMRKTLRDRDI